MIDQYLQKLDFTEKERAIYVVLAEIGIQPASVVARRSGLDRVTAYKHLKKLAERGFLKTYVRDGIQCFGIGSFEALEEYVQARAEDFRSLADEFPVAMNLLKSLGGKEESIPRLQIFEGESGMKALFRDLLHELSTEKLKLFRMLSSNTFEERVNDKTIEKIVAEFFADLTERDITVELFEATGALVPEHLEAVHLFRGGGTLPIARGSTGIFVAGHAIYLISCKADPVGLKVKQADLSQIVHFIFDLLGKKVQ